MNLLNWFARRKIKACSEEMENKLTVTLTTNVCYLRLVDPPTVTRDDFGDKFDKVVEVTEGKDETDNG